MVLRIRRIRIDKAHAVEGIRADNLDGVCCGDDVSRPPTAVANQLDHLEGVEKSRPR